MIRIDKYDWAAWGLGAIIVICGAIGACREFGRSTDGDTRYGKPLYRLSNGVN